MQLIRLARLNLERSEMGSGGSVHGGDSRLDSLVAMK